MKIAITTSGFAEYSSAPLDLLRERGLAWELNPHGRTLTAAEAINLLQGCVAVAAGLEPLQAEVLSALPQLKVISRCGVGVDNVDREFARERGIKVFATGAPARAVAELVLACALDLCRHVSRMDRELRQGGWKKRMGGLLLGKKIGIVGYGAIGRATGALFAALGCQLACHDPYAKNVDIPQMDLPELLEWCDCLTLHTPKLPGGQLLLDAEALGRLKPGALLINAARGGLIDEAALYGALKSGRLGGAALDVFAAEPYKGPLSELDNVVLTPHAGSYARETRIEMEVETIRNLLKGLRLE